MLETISRLLGETVGGTMAPIAGTESDPLSRDKLSVLLDLIPTPILLAVNPSATDIRSNSKGRTLFRSDRNQNLSQSAPEKQRPAFEVWSKGKIVPFESLPMQYAALTGSPVRGSECELRFADGEVRYISGNVDPLFTPDGSIRGSLGVFLDITQIKLLEHQNALLTREIQHRARNSISLVQMLARQTLKTKLSVADFAAFEDRLLAIGRSVEISVASGEDAPTVERVIKAALEPLLGAASSRVEVCGPPIRVSAQDVVTISMSVHELTTNAFKYGALSNSNGKVLVSWAPSQDNKLVTINWIERGGPSVSAPTRKGFGTKLLSTLTRDRLGRRGETSYNMAGLEYRLILPISA